MSKTKNKSRITLVNRASGTKEKPRDWYSVNGVRYLREDLVTVKVDNIMERIAVAQEVQADFYKKWDKIIEPLMGALKLQMKVKGINVE